MEDKRSMNEQKKLPAPRAMAPEGRPLQWDDLDATGKKAGAQLMRNTGSGLRDQLANARTKLSAAASSPTAAAGHKLKSLRALSTLGAVESSLKDVPVTIGRAAQNRVDLVKRGATRAVEDSESHGTSRLREAGAGWYFDHHKDLQDISRETGIDKEKIISGSAAMSPLNSPDNEKTAIGALARLHQHDPDISFSPKAQKALGVDASTKKFSALNDDQVSQLGTASLSGHITARGMHPDTFRQLSAGGTNTNIKKAQEVLRGAVHPDDAIDPHSSAKVWSYRDSIRKAVPGGAEHEEYLTRANTALFEAPGQQHLDLWGLKDSHEGSLNPNKTTAEDTWMGAISSGQQLASVPGATGRPLSPAKFLVSTKPTSNVPKTTLINGKKVSVSADKRITGESVKHAFHNKATVESARLLSTTGNSVPSTLPQEVSWTQARIEASKDPSYNQRDSGEHTSRGSAPRSLRTSARLPHVEPAEIETKQMAAQRAKFGKPQAPKVDARSDRAKSYGVEF